MPRREEGEPFPWAGLFAVLINIALVAALVYRFAIA